MGLCFMYACLKCISDFQTVSNTKIKSDRNLYGGKENNISVRNKNRHDLRRIEADSPSLLRKTYKFHKSAQRIPENININITVLLSLLLTANYIYLHNICSSVAFQAHATTLNLFLVHTFYWRRTMKSTVVVQVWPEAWCAHPLC